MDYEKEEKNNIFEIISSRSKVKILSSILEGPLSVNKIVNLTKIEQTNVSHILNTLLESKIVNKKIKGRTHEYSINNDLKPLLKKLISDINKNEDLFKKAGILALIILLTIRYLPTGDITGFFSTSYSLIIQNNLFITSLI
ncbi:MAG: helix-turn-helix domain-containing protein [Candidatus Micrarchaeaceae archaeon]